MNLLLFCQVAQTVHLMKTLYSVQHHYCIKIKCWPFTENTLCRQNPFLVQIFSDGEGKF